jgi:hypothetical protein
MHKNEPKPHFPNEPNQDCNPMEQNYLATTEPTFNPRAKQVPVVGEEEKRERVPGRQALQIESPNS